MYSKMFVQIHWSNFEVDYLHLNNKIQWASVAHEKFKGYLQTQIYTTKVYFAVVYSLNEQIDITFQMAKYLFYFSLGVKRAF